MTRHTASLCRHEVRLLLWLHEQCGPQTDVPVPAAEFGRQKNMPGLGVAALIEALQERGLVRIQEDGERPPPDAELTAAGLARAEQLVADLGNPDAVRRYRQRVTRALADLRPTDPRTHLEVTGDWNRPVFERTEQVAELAQLVKGCARILGHDLTDASVGGASDGNFLAAAGIPVLDGIGAVGSGAHARSEHTTVSGMVERAALAASVLGASAGR
ncbi:M20/M25/M40 family metallo-hydrolase [Streptomyces sp. NPDC051684]|uniref:M20/M25/M40 family metallo-hydrolase n=1 Tax=Streptomyces sp. NPDC051684 TaxID=3365670 RepID=UPI0037AF2565